MSRGSLVLLQAKIIAVAKLISLSAFFTSSVRLFVISYVKNRITCVIDANLFLIVHSGMSENFTVKCKQYIGIS